MPFPNHSLFDLWKVLQSRSQKLYHLPFSEGEFSKTLRITEPYSENDASKSVCVIFGRNADKHWVDEGDPDRTGAQYDGVIFNNMGSTIITDWNFSISVPEGCSVDPGPWNGTFTLLEGSLNVKKPHEGDKENIHGVDFYTITPLAVSPSVFGR